jgi:hypothetical protein
LAQIAKNDPDRDVREWAVWGINDPSVAADVASTADDGRVREWAVAKVEDQRALVEILKRDTSPGVVKRVVARIDGPTLVQLAESLPAEKRRPLIEELVRKSPDHVAQLLSSTNPETRIDAMFNTYNAATIQRLSKSDPSPAVRLWASILAAADATKDLVLASSPSCATNSCSVPLRNNGQVAYREVRVLFYGVVNGEVDLLLGKAVEPGATETGMARRPHEPSSGGMVSIRVVRGTPTLPSR